MNIPCVCGRRGSAGGGVAGRVFGVDVSGGDAGVVLKGLAEDVIPPCSLFIFSV